MHRLQNISASNIAASDSIQDLTYVWRTKCVKPKVSDFILKTTFSRVKLCVETKYDIKNAQL